MPLGAAWGLSWGSWGPSGGVFGNMLGILCLVLEAFGGLLESLGCQRGSKSERLAEALAYFSEFYDFSKETS